MNFFKNKNQEFFRVHFLLFALIPLFLQSCEFFDSPEPEQQKQDCEINSYGTVILVNQTGKSLFVDVTWGGSFENEERKIQNGKSTTYYKVPAGPIVIWGAFEDTQWHYIEVSLEVCQEFKFIWFPHTIQSSQKNAFFVEVLDKEGNLIKTFYTERERLK